MQLIIRTRDVLIRLPDFLALSGWQIAPDGVPLLKIPQYAWRQGAGWALVCDRDLSMGSGETREARLILAVFYSAKGATDAISKIISEVHQYAVNTVGTHAAAYVDIVACEAHGKEERMAWLKQGKPSSRERQRVITLDEPGTAPASTNAVCEPPDDSQPVGIPLMTYAEWHLQQNYGQSPHTTPMPVGRGIGTLSRAQAAAQADALANSRRALERPAETIVDALRERFGEGSGGHVGTLAPAPELPDDTPRFFSDLNDQSG